MRKTLNQRLAKGTDELEFRRQISRLMLLTLLFGLLLAGCHSDPELLPTIRLGYAPHDHHAALYVAAQMPDYFRTHGGLYLEEVEPKKNYQLIENGRTLANVSLHSSVGGGQLIRKLHEKQFDVVLGGVPAMLKQIDAGSELKIVAPLMSDGAALVLAKDIPVNDWTGFVALAKKTEKPLRIGYKIETSVQNLIFEQALLAENISFSRENEREGDQVVVLNLHGAKNLIPALKNDLIDGFVIMQPFAALAEHQQVGKTVAQLSTLPPEGQWVGTPCCAIGANGELLTRQREELTKLVTLLLRANLYLQGHLKEGGSLVADWLGRPSDVERLSLPSIKFLVEYDDHWHRGVDSWILSMNQQGRVQGGLRAAALEGTAKEQIYDLQIYNRARERVGQP